MSLLVSLCIYVKCVLICPMMHKSKTFIHKWGYLKATFTHTDDHPVVLRAVSSLCFFVCFHFHCVCFLQWTGLIFCKVLVFCDHIALTYFTFYFHFYPLSVALGAMTRHRAWASWSTATVMSMRDSGTATRDTVRKPCCVSSAVMLPCLRIVSLISVFRECSSSLSMMIIQFSQ